MSHAGYTIELDEKMKESILTIMKETFMDENEKTKMKVNELALSLKLRKTAYTAFVYGNLDEAKTWYNKNRNKTGKKLCVNGVFISIPYKTIVLQGTIDGKPTYVTLTHNNTRLILIKKHANTGMYGKKIPFHGQFDVVAELTKVRVQPRFYYF